ncbi:Lipase [Diplonema papillatum]|nr:Lipase [Diplonema papillatum]
MNKNSFSPYIVLVDHEDRSVVVSFRGTLSLQDVVTDVRAHGEALLDDNGSTRGHVHKGILKVARNLKNDIVKRGTVLKQLERFPQYRLALTGHSLGAGTATLVAALLKGNVEFDRRLHCYAFSPPGALGCEDISVAVKPYVTAVAFGKDIIPRLSEVTIQKLRDDIVFHLSVNGHCPKHRVIGTCGCRSYSPPPEVQSMMSSGPPGVPSPLRETVLNIDDANIPGKLAESMAAFAEHSTRVQKDALEQRRRMYPMGSLLHFVKDERDDRSCLPSFRKKWKYSPMWRRYDELQEIMISREMVNDHFPDRNLDILLSVLERVQQGILLDIPTSDLSREGLMSPYSIAVQSPFGAPSSAPFSTRMDPLTSPSSPARQRSPFDWQPRLLGDDSPSLSFKRLDTNPGSDAASLSPLSPKISSKQNVLNPSGQDAVCRL